MVWKARADLRLPSSSGIRSVHGSLTARSAGDYSGELLPTESVLASPGQPNLNPASALRAEMNQWRFYHHFRTTMNRRCADPPLAIG